MTNEVVFMEGFEEHQTLHAAESVFEGGTLWRPPGYVTEGASPAVHGKYLHNTDSDWDMGLVIRDRNADGVTDLTVGFRVRASMDVTLIKHVIIDILDQTTLPDWATRSGKQQTWIYLDPSANGTYVVGVASAHDGLAIVESQALEPSQWYYVEVYIKLNGTGNGVVELRIDETTQGTRVTDKRTSGVGSGNWGHLFVSLPPAAEPNGAVDFDDFWVYDGDHFFGNVTMETVFPDAAGIIEDWTLVDPTNKTGGVKYKAVDDERDAQGKGKGDHDDDDTYLQEATVSKAFDFSMEDFRFLSGNVFAIKFSADAALKNAGSKAIQFSFNAIPSAGGPKVVNKTAYHKIEDISTHTGGISLPSNFSVGAIITS